MEENKNEEIEFTDNKSKVEKKVKRKQKRTKVALSCFVLLLAAGIIGNWYWENSSISTKVKPVLSASNTESSKTLGEASFVDATTEATTASDYFTKAKLDREKARDKRLDELQKVVDSSNSESAKKIAAEDIAKISSFITIENKIETLIKAKGIENCVAVVSDDGGSVEVIVDVKELSDNVIVQVKEISMKQLGCTYSNVAIIQPK